MTHGMTIGWRDDGFELTGELDIASAPPLEELLVGVAAMTPEVVVRMSGVTFFDSSGVRLLVELQRSLETSGRRMAVGSPSPAVRRVLDMAGLTQHIHFVEAGQVADVG